MHSKQQGGELSSIWLGNLGARVLESQLAPTRVPTSPGFQVVYSKGRGICVGSNPSICTKVPLLYDHQLKFKI